MSHFTNYDEVADVEKIFSGNGEKSRSVSSKEPIKRLI